MKIAFFEIKGWEKRFLKKKLKGHELLFCKDPLTSENVDSAKGCDVVSVFIYSKIDCDMISKLPALKFITTRSTGFDHIDLDSCSTRGIKVCNVPFYGENTVAEHTFALILALSRRLHAAYMKALQKDFSIDGLKGFDLKGKTLGVVGAGRIGLHVIRIARGFGMDVLAYDVNRDSFLEDVLGFRYADLPEVLSKSDVITMHVPYNKHTHHLINRDNISMIKKGALFINTSRGGVAESIALIEALDKKILSGIGVDVLEGEELIKEEKQLLYAPEKAEVLGELINDHILLSRDNVVFTPHIAFYSQEALERILECTCQNIIDFENGRDLSTCKVK